MDRTASWATEATAEHVGWLRGEVADFAERAGFAAAKVADIRLAVSEAVTNAVVHAYRHRSAPGLVRVRASADGVLVVVVEDDGAGPQPRPDSPGAGLGLPLMATLTSTVHVERCPNGGTCVTLSFEREKAGEARPHAARASG